jgi:hypothetical protein
MTSSDYTPSDHKESIISQFTKQAMLHNAPHIAIDTYIIQLT